MEANIALVEDDEPTLLLANCVKEELKVLLSDKNGVTQSLLSKNDKKTSETNLWYLDNDAINHMT